MQTWVCAVLFIIVGYLLAVLIGMLMNLGKVRETNKLNRDNVIGLMDGFTLIVSYVVQTDKSLVCKAIPTAEASKQVYNDLLSKYSERKIIGMVNQALKYTNDKKFSESDILTFFGDVSASYLKVMGKYCTALAPGPVSTMQAPQNYNLGPYQYMAKSGCGM
jgi:hypothetical protein